MRRFRKKRNQPSVSLFPFLAVLICTLGVLIIMLVLAVKSADVNAQEKKAEIQQQTEEQTQAVEFEVQLQQQRAAAILKMRVAVVDRLTESRKNRAYLQEDVRHSNEQLEDAVERLDVLRRQVQRAAGQVPTDPVDQLAAQERITDLKAQIAAAQVQLESQIDKKKQSGDTKYSLLPYNGSGGTFRRPIYVECSADGIRLQPLGITISKNDFTRPIQAGNPLDAALLSIQEYWQSNDVAGQDGSPYPLLVVRPDGAETFVLARRAMKSWAEEFGYELVDAKKDLDFGPEDPILTARIEQLIEKIKQEQYLLAVQRRRLQQHLEQFDGGGARGGLSASRTTGGFVSAAPAGGVSTSSFQNDPWGPGPGGNGPVASAGYAGSPASATGRQTAASELADRSRSGSVGPANRNNAANQNRQQNRPAANSQQGRSAAGGNGQGPTQLGSINGPDSLARRRGTGWALPSQTVGGTGYLRPITVICNQDHLRLRDTRGNWQQIPFAGSTETAVDKMVEEIWKKIDSWGIAGRGSYWKPQLRIVTEAGAEQRYQDLQRLLFNSGLVVQRGDQP